MNALFLLWSAHGTKLLGYAQAILAGWLLIPDLFPPSALPYAHAAGVVLAVLTVQRGHMNTKRTRAEDSDDGNEAL